MRRRGRLRARAPPRRPSGGRESASGYNVVPDSWKRLRFDARQPVAALQRVDLLRR